MGDVPPPITVSPSTTIAITCDSSPSLSPKPEVPLFLIPKPKFKLCGAPSFGRSKKSSSSKAGSDFERRLAVKPQWPFFFFVVVKKQVSSSASRRQDELGEEIIGDDSSISRRRSLSIMGDVIEEIRPDDGTTISVRRSLRIEGNAIEEIIRDGASISRRRSLSIEGNVIEEISITEGHLIRSTPERGDSIPGDETKARPSMQRTSFSYRLETEEKFSLSPFLDPNHSLSYSEQLAPPCSPGSCFDLVENSHVIGHSIEVEENGSSTPGRLKRVPSCMDIMLPSGLSDLSEKVSLSAKRRKVSLADSWKGLKEGMHSLKMNTGRKMNGGGPMQAKTMKTTTTRTTSGELCGKPVILGRRCRVQESEDQTGGTFYVGKGWWSLENIMNMPEASPEDGEDLQHGEDCVKEASPEDGEDLQQCEDCVKDAQAKKKRPVSDFGFGPVEDEQASKKKKIKASHLGVGSQQ